MPHQAMGGRVELSVCSTNRINSFRMLRQLPSLAHSSVLAPLRARPFLPTICTMCAHALRHDAYIFGKSYLFGNIKDTRREIAEHTEHTERNSNQQQTDEK